MKQVIRFVSHLLLTLLMGMALVGCGSDSFEEDIPVLPTGQPVQVSLRIGVQEPQETGSRDWDNSRSLNEEGEKMYSWFVIIAQEERVVDIIEKTGFTDLETDEVGTVTLATGTYDFYSFANIERSSIPALASLEKGQLMPDLSAVTYQVNGNGFDVKNQYIPMSNKQTFTISATTTQVELWVVRMLAKMTLRFTNATAQDITITSATLSEITANAPGNLKLLPAHIDGNSGETGACTPNLGTLATADYTYTPSSSITVPTNNADSPVSMTFYINESAKPTQNAHGLFTLSLNTDKGVMRYALITNENENWDFIARNDHRVIPVTLQDYRLDIIPYDWPPIGVYPASVKQEDGLFTVTFHSGGHFHLQPVVSKYGDNTHLSYGETGADTWSYVSWTTPAGTIPEDFYEADNSTVDGCENGGEPVWDSTNHFIFGNLKDTGILPSGQTAPKAFHDLTVSVNTGGTPAIRQLTYHLCIVKEITY